jgi:hypothetical protein
LLDLIKKTSIFYIIFYLLKGIKNMSENENLDLELDGENTNDNQTGLSIPTGAVYS